MAMETIFAYDGRPRGPGLVFSGGSSGSGNRESVLKIATNRTSVVLPATEHDGLEKICGTGKNKIVWQRTGICMLFGSV
jgi:hypothetical protein